MSKMNVIFRKIIRFIIAILLLPVVPLSILSSKIIDWLTDGEENPITLWLFREWLKWLTFKT